MSNELNLTLVPVLEGYYDNSADKVRYLFRNGRRKGSWHGHLCGHSADPHNPLHQPWGTYPDLGKPKEDPTITRK